MSVVKSAAIVTTSVLLGLAVGLGISPSKNKSLRPVELYPETPLSVIADGKWTRPRAAVMGEVSVVRKEEDGDFHVKLVDGDKFIVYEICPEYPIIPPKVGQRVVVKGIVRYDPHGGHGWWEIHPVFHWELVK